MKITFVGQMVATTQAFEKLIKSLEEETRRIYPGAFVGSPDDFDDIPKYTFQIFLGNGAAMKPLNEILEAVRSSYAVIVGMASQPDIAKEEIEAIRTAKNEGKLVCVYSDTWGLKTHFLPELPGTTLFVINESEAEKARKAVPEAKVIVAGNPMFDEFFFPKITCQQSRELIGVTDPNLRILLCPLGKDLSVNEFHIKTVLEWATGMPNLLVVISTHGGDSPTNMSNYKALVDATTGVDARVVSGKEIKGTNLVPGSTVIVGSASTIEFEGVCIRKPVGDLLGLNPAAVERYSKSTNGLLAYPPVDEGVIVDFSKVVNPADTLKMMLCDDPQFRVVRDRMETLYPVPTEKGVAIRTMHGEIDRALSKQRPSV